MAQQTMQYQPLNLDNISSPSPAPAANVNWSGYQNPPTYAVPYSDTPGAYSNPLQAPDALNQSPYPSLQHVVHQVRATPSWPDTPPQYSQHDVPQYNQYPQPYEPATPIRQPTMISNPHTGMPPPGSMAAACLSALPPHMSAGFVAPPVPEGVDPLCGPLYGKPAPPNVLAVTVHKSDAFEHDTMLTQPVVRMHVLDPNTGDYMRSLIPQGIMIDSHTQDMMLRYPGRPATLTCGNNTDLPDPALQEYLPPLQTAPYNLLRRTDPAAAACWEETLVVDEALERLLALDALVVFEVLQLPASFHRYKKHPDQFPAGAHRVAWAFLRLAAPDSSVAPDVSGLVTPPGSPGRSDQPRRALLGKLKLQLYKYRPDPILPGNRTAQEEAEKKLAAAPTRAFTAWKALMSSSSTRGINLKTGGIVDKYPAALHVTVGALPRPQPEVVKNAPGKELRAVLPAGYGSGFEEGSVNILQYLAQTFGTGAGGLGGGLSGATQIAVESSPFYRSRGERCRLPNKVWKVLAPGAGGCCCAAFSHDGGKVAVACGESPRADLFHIVIYSTVNCQELARMTCAHKAWVHCITWAKDDTALLTTSSDATAQVWEMAMFQPSHKSIKPRVLRHVSSVYTGTFHPATSQLPVIITAGRSGCIHIWHRFRGAQLSVIAQEGPSLSPALLSVHQSITFSRMAQSTAGTTGRGSACGELCGAVTSLVFDLQGTRLWAADDKGAVQEFSVDSAAIQDAIQSLEHDRDDYDDDQQQHPGAYQAPPLSANFSPLRQDDVNRDMSASCQLPPPSWQLPPPAFQDNRGVQYPQYDQPGLPPPMYPPVQFTPDYTPQYQQQQHAVAQQPDIYPDNNWGNVNPGNEFTVYQSYGSPQHQQVDVGQGVKGPLWAAGYKGSAVNQYGGSRPDYYHSMPHHNNYGPVCEGVHSGKKQSDDPAAWANFASAQNNNTNSSSTGNVTHVSSKAFVPQMHPTPISPVQCRQAPPGQARRTRMYTTGQSVSNPVTPSGKHGITTASTHHLQSRSISLSKDAFIIRASCPGPLAEAIEAPASSPSYAAAHSPVALDPHEDFTPATRNFIQTIVPSSRNRNRYAGKSPEKRDAEGSLGNTLKSTIRQDAKLLRAMRSCKALQNEAIASMTLHPSGRKLIIITRQSKMVTLDTRAFRDTVYMGKVRCKDAMVKPACSPDGAYIIAGGEDGNVTAWDGEHVSTASDLVPCVALPHVALPPASTLPRPVHCTAWNPAMHMVAVCGWGSWSPLLLGVYDEKWRGPDIELQLPNGVAAGPRIDKSMAAMPSKKYELPDRLTPALVHALLADVRGHARQRGVLPSPPLDPHLRASTPPGQFLRSDDDPNKRGAYGEPVPYHHVDHLVVPRQHESVHDLASRQHAEKQAQKQREAQEEARRLSGRLDLNCYSPENQSKQNAAGAHETLTFPAVQQAASIAETVKMTPAQDNTRMQGDQRSMHSTDGPGGPLPLQYAPRAVDIGDKDGPDSSRAATLLGKALPGNGAPDQATSYNVVTLGSYQPQLSGHIADGPESTKGVISAGLKSAGNAQDADRIRPRHTPLSETAALKKVGFSAAVPPQGPDVAPAPPIMAGPGVTVVVGPGATVITHEGARVIPVANPLDGYTPNVSQAPYDMNLSKQLPVDKQPGGVAAHIPGPSHNAATDMQARAVSSAQLVAPASHADIGSRNVTEVVAKEVIKKVAEAKIAEGVLIKQDNTTNLIKDSSSPSPSIGPQVITPGPSMTAVSSPPALAPRDGGTATVQIVKEISSTAATNQAPPSSSSSSPASPPKATSSENSKGIQSVVASSSSSSVIMETKAGPEASAASTTPPLIGVQVGSKEDVKAPAVQAVEKEVPQVKATTPTSADVSKAAATAITQVTTTTAINISSSTAATAAKTVGSRESIDKPMVKPEASSSIVQESSSISVSKSTDRSPVGVVDMKPAASSQLKAEASSSGAKDSTAAAVSQSSSSRDMSSAQEQLTSKVFSAATPVTTGTSPVQPSTSYITPAGSTTPILTGGTSSVTPTSSAAPAAAASGLTAVKSSHSIAASTVPAVKSSKSIAASVDSDDF